MIWHIFCQPCYGFLTTSTGICSVCKGHIFIKTETRNLVEKEHSWAAVNFDNNRLTLKSSILATFEPGVIYPAVTNESIK